MSRPLPVKTSLILVIALALGLIFWGLSQRKETATPPVVRKTSPYPIWIQGFTASTYKGNRLITKIEADEFKVNPRRFFVFNIKPLNEATLTNVRLEIHIYMGMSSKADLFSFGEGVLPLMNGGKKFAVNGMGLITRGVIKGLILKIYRADSLSIVVKASRGYIDFKKKETKMQGVSLEDVVSGRLIKSSSVIWDDTEKAFKVPGEYIAMTPEGRARGRGIKVDLNFVVTPLKE